MDKWIDYLSDVIPGRVAKPRISGLTMVIDTGVPITAMRDLFELAAAHIDYWKIGFGSAAVCTPERIADKVSLCQEYDIRPYPGGTAFEIAYYHKQWRPYLEALYASGVHVVEISDGTIELSRRARREAIDTALAIGFQVLTEVGKKVQGMQMPIAAQIEQVREDLHHGASYVIVEARESGHGIGIYDEIGEVLEHEMDALLKGVEPLANRLIWEAPLKMQQIYHLRKFGHKANLGNIQPLDVISLESLRRGLRSDTMADILPPSTETSDEPASTIGRHLSEKSSPTLWIDGKPPTGKVNDKNRGFT